MVQRTRSILTNIIKIILFIMPPAWGLYIVWKYGVDVFYMDEWDFFDHYINSPLNLEILWEQHNEHRMLFPQLLTYVVGSTFRWSSKALMYTSVIICFILYILTIIIYMKEKESKHISVMDAVMFFVLGSVIFNACQWENQLWGFQTAWFLIITCVAGSFLLYDKYLRSGIRFFLIAAMLVAIIASFSSLHGLVIWGAYAILLLAGKLNGEEIDRSGFMIPLITGVICFVLYFYNYHAVAAHEKLYAANSDDFFSFFFAQIGATLLESKYSLGYMLGFTIFLVIMTIFIIVIVKKEVLTKIIYFGPIISSFGMMLSVALGRSHAESIVSSRYTTNSTLLLVYFVLLASNYLWKTYRGETKYDLSDKLMIDIEALVNKTLLVLFLIIPLLVVERNLGCIEELNYNFDNRTHAYIQLVNFDDVTAEDLGCVNQAWKPEHLKADDIEKLKANFFDYLKRNHLNAFSEDYEAKIYKKQEETHIKELHATNDNFEDLLSMVNIVNIENKLIITLPIEEISKKLGITEKELKNDKYFIFIGNDVYTMVPDGDTIRFSKDISKIPFGYNNIQIIIDANDDRDMIYSNLMIYCKTDYKFSVYEYNQVPSSVINSYEHCEDNNSFWIDCIDNTPITDNSVMIIEKDREHTINGWTYVNDIENNTVYLRLGDSLFEMNWIERPDVIEANKDSAYSGFEGRFLAYNIANGLYDIEIMIINNDARTYYANSLGKLYIK